MQVVTSLSRVAPAPASLIRYQGIIRDLPLGLGRQAHHNATSMGWLDGLTDDALAARLLAEQEQDGQAGGVARRDELAAAGAAGRRKRCHVVRKIEVSVTSSDQVGGPGGCFDMSTWAGCGGMAVQAPRIRGWLDR